MIRKVSAAQKRSMSEDSKHTREVENAAAAPTMSWSDCPAEVLQLVLSRLTSLGDLACFPAVCTWWRSVSLLDGRRPAAPRLWLMACAPPSADESSTLFWVCLEDTGRVFRRPVPEALRRGQCCGSAGYGFLAVFQQKHLGGREIVLVDPFSTAAAAPPPLSLTQKILGMTLGEVNRAIRWRGGPSCVRKVVLSDAPSSAKCLVAAIVGNDRERGSLAVWDARSPGGRRLKLNQKDDGGSLNDLDFHDVAFCNGELYAITSTENLVCLRITGGAITVGRLDIAPRPGDHYDGWKTSSYPRHDIQANYLVVVPAGVSCRRRLLMVVRRVPGLQNSRVPRFRVFELTPGAKLGPLGRVHEWNPIDTLDGHAIFLGRGCSAAVDVSGHDGVKSGRIYFADDWYSSWGDWERTRDHGEGIYCMYYNSFEPLPQSSDLAASMSSCSAPAMWVLPATDPWGKWPKPRK